MGSVRLRNDQNRYIRKTKFRKYMARPFLEGERYYLGLFETIEEARAAIKKFWWGKLEDLPKYTYGIRAREGPRYFALIRHKGKTYKLGPLANRDEASAAARMGCMILFGDNQEQALRRMVKTIAPHLRQQGEPKRPV